MNIFEMNDKEFLEYMDKQNTIVALWHDRSMNHQKCWFPVYGDHGVLWETFFPSFEEIIANAVLEKKIKVREWFHVWRGETGIDPELYNGKILLCPYTDQPIYAIFEDDLNNALLFCREVARACLQ